MGWYRLVLACVFMLGKSTGRQIHYKGDQVMMTSLTDKERERPLSDTPNTRGGAPVEWRSQQLSRLCACHTWSRPPTHRATASPHAAEPPAHARS